jgi:N6-adenosine-specific RNA methylase IME4
MPTKHNVIYADPPYRFRDKNSNGKRGACFRYNTMSLDEIAAMHPYIDSIAAPDCALLLWMPASIVAEGGVSKIMGAWGFVPKTLAFCWVKTTPTKPMQVCGINLKMCLGHWTRQGVELCWLGVRGKPKRKGKSVHQVIFSDVRETDRKPDECYELIDELFGTVPRIELFARQRWPGWAHHGDEVDKFTRKNI